MTEKRFLKGLFKDTGQLDQPESTWRYALNAVLNTQKGAISNEAGAEYVTKIDPDFKAIGAIEISDGRVVLFLKNLTDKQAMIVLLSNNIITVLFKPPLLFDLNFNTSYPIEGTFKIDSKGDLVVYWVDDLNPPRAFNVSRQERSLSEGSSVNRLYGLNAQPFQNQFDVTSHLDILNLFPSSGPVPKINISTDPLDPTIKEGGGLLTGVYYLALAYVDEDLVATNYLSISDPISIVEEFQFTKPTTKVDGAKAGSQTSKSITWVIDNLNPDYKYIRPIVIRKLGTAVDAFRLNDVANIPYATTIASKKITFSGVEGVSSAAVADVIIDTVGYESAKTINQLDNVLYLGNVTSNKDVGFQKYANAIQVESTIEPITYFDPFYASQDNLETGFATSAIDGGYAIDASKSYRNYILNSKYRGYMRDETYAFYVAFILKDGSMSYAYHIPGRENLYISEKTSLSAGGAMNEAHMSALGPHSKKFHLLDSSSPSFLVDNFYENRISEPKQQMNYWENSTELYPDTENYDIFHIKSDGTSSNGTEIDPSIALNKTLRSENVRHHHFPSNDNYFRRSINAGHLGSSSIATASTSNYANNVDWSGTVKFYRSDSDTSSYGNVAGPANIAAIHNNTKYTGDQMSESLSAEWSPPLLFQSAGLSNMTNANLVGEDFYREESTPITNANNVGTVTINNGVYNGGTGIFVADQAMTISNMKFKVWWFREEANFTTMKTRVVIETANNERYYTIPDNNITNNDWGVSGYNTALGVNHWDYNYKDNINEMYPEATTSQGTVSGTAVPITLGIGDKMWVEGRAFIGYDPDKGIRQAGTTESDGPQQPTGQDNYWQFDIDTTPTSEYDTDGYDATISHNVQALGFHLNNFKIPKSIADKVQGFRVYRAKRNHANKTILGQDILLPMPELTTAIGACSEASTGADSILESLSGQPELFHKKEPWPGPASNYPDGYNHFSFHDFNLLRTKNSLAGATHIKPIYMVNNLVWNGPTLKQDKKSLTTIVDYDPLTPNELKQHWGYDVEFNCYAEDINSAIFIGLDYVFNVQKYNDAPDVPEYRFARLLNQKAKTYLRGDSIFDATALGFGGKIVNNFGESAIVLSTQQYMGALTCAPDGTASDESDFFGKAPLDAPPWLVNQPLMASISTSNSADTIANTRYLNYMVNLHAYKTDVYKSIDSQELVWTGYEVVGKELENFIFNDDATSDKYLNHIKAGPEFISSGYNKDTIYTTKKGATLVGAANTGYYTNGIFGGDTFICRYGFASAITPIDNASTSNPKRAIYYNIVESSDNINFRHAEDNDSMYFPHSPAKNVLKNVGDKDLTHQDNVRYNDNYSSDSDIRTAFPLPLRDTTHTAFPTRAHRSATADNTSIIDNYRIFLANQYKDLPKNRGDLWKLSSFNNLLYFHMENSLFATKGKQTMEMKDGTEAFVGSGDIFVQPPDEILQTELGYGGTQSQWAALTTRYGYFFVNKKDSKVFLMAQALTDISALGMESWFKSNLKFELERFGLPETFDNPIVGIGLHSVWDPEQKRIVLTKRDKRPTRDFIHRYGSGVNPSIRFNNTAMQYELVTSVTTTTSTGEAGATPTDNWNLFIEQWEAGNAYLLQSYESFQEFGPSEIPNILPANSSGQYSLPVGALVLLDTYNPFGGLTATEYLYTIPTAPIVHWVDEGGSNALVINTVDNMPAQFTNTAGVVVFYENPQTYVSTLETTSNTNVTTALIDYNNPNYFTNSGWSISFNPEINAWVSFHSYIPYLYFNALGSFMALSDTASTIQTNDAGAKLLELDSVIWSHRGTNNFTYGQYYQNYVDAGVDLVEGDFGTGFPEYFDTNPFIIDFVHNENRAMAALYSSIAYTVDVVNASQSNLSEGGFDQFYVYNTNQLSGLQDLKYLANTRKVGTNWKINSFRDMSKLLKLEESDPENYWLHGEDTFLGSPLLEYTTTTANNMFVIDGMNEIINNSYIDDEKIWSSRKKFVDKWVGIRLICLNLRNNLVNLYTSSVEARKYYR